MACTLAAGAAAGTVPDQWGGVFGQEWVEQAFGLLPGPGGGGLRLERAGCSIAALVDSEENRAAPTGAAAASSGSLKRGRGEQASDGLSTDSASGRKIHKRVE